LIAVTGGTGSFGSAFIQYLLENTDDDVVCISRSDGRQEELARSLRTPRLRCIPVDICNYVGLLNALDGADYVVHAAALKRVPQSIIHTDEYVNVNINGTLNVLRASTRVGVGKFLFISSDKAVAALNPYGSTKAVAEHMTRQYNQFGLMASVVRGGNVWGSSGSVTEIWRKQIDRGLPITVHGPDTTRFYLPMDKWIRFCHEAIYKMKGGETFVPKLSAWKLGDLAKAMHPPHGVVKSKERDGDKKHECLISEEEARATVDIGWAYVINPSKNLGCKQHEGKPIKGALTSSGAPKMGVRWLEELLSKDA